MNSPNTPHNKSHTYVLMMYKVETILQYVYRYITTAIQYNTPIIHCDILYNGKTFKGKVSRLQAKSTAHWKTFVDFSLSDITSGR